MGQGCCWNFEESIGNSDFLACLPVQSWCLFSSIGISPQSAKLPAFEKLHTTMGGAPSVPPKDITYGSSHSASQGRGSDLKGRHLWGCPQCIPCSSAHREAGSLHTFAPSQYTGHVPPITSQAAGSCVCWEPPLVLHRPWNMGIISLTNCSALDYNSNAKETAASHS